VELVAYCIVTDSSISNCTLNIRIFNVSLKLIILVGLLDSKSVDLSYPIHVFHYQSYLVCMHVCVNCQRMNKPRNKQTNKQDDGILFVAIHTPILRKYLDSGPYLNEVEQSKNKTKIQYLCR